MKKTLFLMLLLIAATGIFFSCQDEKQSLTHPFDPTLPIEVTGFYPDSGGIATPIIINGKNFGSDTTGMKVYFVDSLGVKHPSGVVSSNGEKIYALVPKLTYLRQMKVMVERSIEGGKVVSGESDYPFLYKTQTSVTTVVGRPEPNNSNVRTIGGDLSEATLSSPFGICLDDEDNIFISERAFWFQSGGYSGQSPQNDQGTAVQSNLVMADLNNQSVVVLRYGTNYSNSPAFSDEEGNEAVYIPEDSGPYFYQLLKSLSYTPRHRSIILDEETRNIIEGNWKYSFVVNKNDNMIYTVMWKGQLVRINPVTRNVEVLLDNIMPENYVNAYQGTVGSNCYVAFSPIETNVLYVCLEDYNMIKRINLDDLPNQDKETYRGEDYAGSTMYDGPVAGRGWEDGLLPNAKFFSPKQIAFTADGKMYIADTGNHCIRVIDTTVPYNQAMVNTAIGLPQNAGFQDGGPEFAKFNCPAGVAVNSDGTIIYVSDTKNHVIRKLSIE